MEEFHKFHAFANSLDQDFINFHQSLMHFRENLKTGGLKLLPCPKKGGLKLLPDPKKGGLKVGAYPFKRSTEEPPPGS